MIISNTHNYIFVAIPKTATHAIRFQLRKHFDESRDWEQVAKYIDRRLPFPELSRFNHGHLKCRDVAPVLGTEKWASHFKFVICRNPYDRFVSSCCFLYRNSEAFNQNPVEGMKQIISSEKEMNRILLHPQHTFIADSEGGLMVDYVGAFENLNGAYQHVCAQVGIPCEPLAVVNRSEHRDYDEYLEADLKQAVLDYYRRDFELLGYAQE